MARYRQVMLLTYGHGTETADRTAAILRGAGAAALVDIRTAPGSRRNPKFAQAAMEEWLPEAGIAYRWEKRLGGFRRPGPGQSGRRVARGDVPRLALTCLLHL